uniref:protein-tyrosine-phosphatase n=1 Tax=Molossus molossus TaxID=27622 RepID=A0A7J8HIT8_MOLMO|nr:protein tyrosine phosphatase non-receptor type 1 [Molossus molossus]
MEMEKEFEQIDKAGSWAAIYQDIRHEASDFPCRVAKLPKNKNRNRYRDVSPFDHSRIKLHQEDNDYINASLIEMEEAQRSYILTQGPLPNTCGHFWEMVWEQKSRGVVMLNRVMEKGSLKCAQYWPQKEEKQQRPSLEIKTRLMLLLRVSPLVFHHPFLYRSLLVEPSCSCLPSAPHPPKQGSSRPLPKGPRPPQGGLRPHPATEIKKEQFPLDSDINAISGAATHDTCVAVKVRGRERGLTSWKSPRKTFFKSFKYFASFQATIFECIRWFSNTRFFLRDDFVRGRGLL